MSLLLLFLSAATGTPPAGASIRVRNEWRQEVEQIKPDSEFGTKRGKGRAVELLEIERAAQEAVVAPKVKGAKAAKKPPKIKLVAPSIEGETAAAVEASDVSAAVTKHLTEALAQVDAIAAAEARAQADAQAAVGAVQAAIEAERLRLFAIAQMDDLDLMMIG